MANVMITEVDLKIQFMKIVKQIGISDINSEFIIWDKTLELYSNENGCEELKNKTINFLKLLNDTKKRSKEEFDILIKRDIETDIWNII